MNGSIRRAEKLHVLGRGDRIAQAEETPSVEESGGQEWTRQVRGLKGKNRIELAPVLPFILSCVPSLTETHGSHNGKYSHFR